MWLYEGKAVNSEDTEGYVGFVYLIHNTIDNRKYIGKKLLKFSRTKQVKGKRKKVKVDSDWETYFSSSEELKADVELHGEQNFQRTILRFCSSKAECSYWELKYQLQEDVLLHPDKWYNSYVGARIHRNHMIKGHVLKKDKTNGKEPKTESP